MNKIIIGQEAICPDGLGRVVEVGKLFCRKPSYIKVKTYINNRGCHWQADNVELINPRKAKVEKDEINQLGNLLHKHIMNIAAYPPVGIQNPSGQDIAYKTGHRDARHAAAELVLFTLSNFNKSEE